MVITLFLKYSSIFYVSKIPLILESLINTPQFKKVKIK